ncbi:MAG: YfiR family protein [Proteobacteria bacterium]|nr:YfiR family protein [Pseudomonadota bacterium]MBU1056806.1 YfiR family protein [Pseudomonadota bacterium]
MVHKIFISFFVFILLQASTIAAYDELQSSRAMEIQAAFLIKFSSYVKWPEEVFSDPEAPITIAIFGRDPFGSTVDNIARTFNANGRKIEVRRFTDPQAVRQSHILFIPASEIERMDEIIAALSGRPVLLVGNSLEFLNHSGSINFVMVGKKIRFNISRTNYQKMGLVISSKLLSVAHQIQ